jgi:DNA repair protein RadD
VQLRPYQIEPVKKGIDFFRLKKTPPALMVLPTAAGKSIIIAKITKGLGEKVLVIQHTKELLEQNFNKYVGLGGVASIYSAAANSKEIGDVTYATIGSIVNIAHEFKALGIKKVIIDEADRFPREPSGMLRRFIRDAGITHILGLTATPLKLQTNLGEDGTPFSKLVMLTNRSKKGNFFKDIIHITQIKEMVDGQYWSPLLYESYDFDSGDLAYNSTKADYTDDSIRKAYKNQNIGQKIINKINSCDRKAILVAVPSIDEAKEISKKINNSAAVYSGMPAKERKEIINDFKSGKIRVIIQVSILSVGFDYPELDCIITGRPTQSLSWWYQFVGRVTRIHPDKLNGLVVDFVGSVPKFGKVEDLYFNTRDNQWQLFGEGGKLLTGIPLHHIGNYIDGQADPEDLLTAGTTITMPFGKYKDIELRKIPSWYRKWLIENIQWGKFQQDIKDELIRMKNLGI